jgi:hypothetical protein
VFVEILASVQGMDAITTARVRGAGGISLSSAEMGAFGKRLFLSHLYIKTIFLPRQARDKHRES